MVKVCDAEREKLRFTLKDFPHTHFDERKNCCCSFISIIQIKFTPHYVSSRAVCRHHQLERETRDEIFKGNTQNTKKMPQPPRTHLISLQENVSLHLPRWWNINHDFAFMFLLNVAGFMISSLFLSPFFIGDDKNGDVDSGECMRYHLNDLNERKSEHTQNFHAFSPSMNHISGHSRSSRFDKVSHA